MYTHTIVTYLKQTTFRRVACSVAEPEPVGAEVYWLEPEPILKIWAGAEAVVGADFFGVGSGSFFEQVKNKII